MTVLRSIYKYWAALIFVAVVVQIGSAGYGAFDAAHKLDDKGSVMTHKQFDHGFSFHGGFGTLLVGAMIVLLVIGLLARLGRPAIWWPLALALLGVIQIVLAGLGTSSPAFGVLHPINAVVLFVISGLIVHRAFHGRAAQAS